MSQSPDLLFLAHRIPYPPNKGDKIRSWNELKLLARDHRVHLGCFVDAEADWQHVEFLKETCGGECYFAPLDKRTATLRSVRGFLTGEALSLPYYHDRRFAAWVRDVVARHRPRAAVAFSSQMAQYLIDAPPPMIRVMDMIDVDSDKWRQYATRKSPPMSWVFAREARCLERFEIRVAERFDATFLVSRQETEFFQRLAPQAAERVRCVRNGVDTAFFAPQPPQPGLFAAQEFPLVFTGAMDYWPNIDAALWFAREILPAVRTRVAGAVFYIVGSNPTPELRAVARAGEIVVTGTVPDTRPYIAGAGAVVAPLRIARGVQNKVLEAMAMAKPVVTTTKALQGIDAVAGEDLLIADEPYGFAAAIEGIKHSGAHEIAARARACVMRNYGWESNLSYLLDLVAGTGPATSTRTQQTGTGRP
ncbi:MAG: TIGR03087 family PEP-CTERM/XrtA system glycosyltransferase [Alphaproteobacteria bacterium]|nr:TIGR03087 family PEP-CTERM/XrtA system glycosyltransferase [Alphaproteobacteria bacterium]